MKQENKVGELVKNRYVIAGLKTEMALRTGGIAERQAREYLCNFEGEPELFVGLGDEYLQNRHKEYTHLSLDDCEYMWTGALFCQKLLSFEGFMLHASAVVYQGRAYLFSAPSGTGKSTHTSLWCKVFGEDSAYIINDDKPVIRLYGDEIRVCGTPWSGKTDQNRNISVPLQGICFLERSKENWIRPIDTKTAVFRILNQTIRPENGREMGSLLSVLDKLLPRISVFQMGCNISEDAVMTAFDAMSKQ